MSRTGRPEQPLVTDGPLSQFGVELRRMRERAGLTYSQLAEKAGLSAATLRAAASGTRVPTWEVTRAFAGACDEDESAIRPLWAAARLAAGRSVPPEPPTEPPDPQEAATAADLIGRLNQLLAWAEYPSLAELNRRAGADGHNLLPPSTVWDMLRSQRLPRLQLMLDFVRACGLGEDQVSAWRIAWEFIKEREDAAPAVVPAVPSPPESRSRRIGRLFRRPLIIAACMAFVLGVLSATDVVRWSFLGAELGAVGSFGAGSGLQSAPMPRICTKDGPVVFAVSGRQNRPAPVMTSSMLAAAGIAVREGSAIGVVNLDGRPYLAKAGTFSDSAGTLLELRRAEGSITSAVTNTRAEVPQANVLGALEVAGQAIRAACSHGGTIYVEDSGLQTVAPLNFSQVGILGISPSSAVSFLAAADELPDLNGVNVVLVGLGDTTGPQVPLSISQQDNVVGIWEAIARAGGAASVDVDPSPLSGPPPSSVPAVSLAPIPATQSWAPSDPSYVFPDSGSVGFEPGTAVFRDRDAAEAALRELARYLAANPSYKIEISGTTARAGSAEADLALSLARADAVRLALVSMGAAPSQIITQGLGWKFPGYENDQGPHGTLLPGPAEHNRSVIITPI